MTAALRRELWRYEPPRPLCVERVLTQREWDVVFLVRAGHGYKQIAAILEISWRTVEKHVANVAKLMGEASSPLTAVRLHADALLATRAPVVTPDTE